MKITVYTYSKCSTCRRATAWLKARGIKFQERPIRETPPSAAELGTALAVQGGNLRRLFNTSSQDYRDLGISERLEALTPAAAFALMAKNGNLIRRPLVIGSGVALSGFNEAAWAEAFAHV